MICAKCLAGTCPDHPGGFSVIHPAIEGAGGRWASGIPQGPVIIKVSPFLDESLPEEAAMALPFADVSETESPADEQEAEAAIYAAFADVILCAGAQVSSRRLQKRLSRLVQALSPRVKERVAGKIAAALQAVPGLLVTPSGRIWLVPGDEVADWDELEDNGLRRSEISAALQGDKFVSGPDGAFFEIVVASVS